MNRVALSRPGQARAAVTLDPAQAMTVAGYRPDAWQVELIRSAATRRQTVVCTSRQSGKALAVDTPIPTPQGWTRMGDLAAGDLVFDERGAVVRVRAAHPARVRDCWRVTFSDGSHLDASGDHLWTVLDLNARRVMRQHYPMGPPEDWTAWRHDHRRAFCGSVTPLTVSTDDMRREGLRRGRERRFAIPTTAPLQLPDATLPLDPWCLGYWLGNGSTDAGIVHTHCDDADEVERRFAAAGHPVTSRRDTGPVRGHTFGAQGLTAVLRSLGVLGRKHIPTSYLRASPAQRLALLRGLMDSDGYGDPAPNQSGAEFSTTLPELAEGFADLVAGLGMRWRCNATRARLNGRDVGPCWRYHATTPMNVFSLRRKASTWDDDPERGFRPFGRRIRGVVSIERLPDQPTRCIEVDSPSRLYLAGRGMIPTHNTTSVAALIASELVRRDGARVLCLAPSQRQSSLILERVGEFLAPYGIAAVRSSQSEILLVTGSVAYAVPASSGTIRGYHSIDLLVLDEAGWIPEPAYAAVRPMTATTGGRIVATSTPAGQRGWYWQAWTSGDWHRIEVPATRVHRLDAEFLRSEARSVPPSVFRSEYLCSFEDSSDGLFLPSVLRRAAVLDDDADDSEITSFAEFAARERTA